MLYLVVISTDKGILIKNVSCYPIYQKGKLLLILQSHAWSMHIVPFLFFAELTAAVYLELLKSAIVTFCSKLYVYFYNW